MKPKESFIFTATCQNGLSPFTTLPEEFVAQVASDGPRSYTWTHFSTDIGARTVYKMTSDSDIQ